MIITYLGKEYFKIEQGKITIAINPISKDSKWPGKVARFGADIVLSTTNHPDYNGIETVTYGETIPLAITGPGDYEVKQIFIKGVGVPTTLDKKGYINTIYSLEIEGIKICFLGPLTRSLAASELDGIDSPDILFVPVGNGLISSAEAYKLAVSLEAGVIIPMDYDQAVLKTFLKEAGEEKVEPIEKWTLKKKDIEGKEGDVVLLSY